MRTDYDPGWSPERAADALILSLVALAVALVLSGCVLPHYLELEYGRGGVDIDGQVTGGGQPRQEWDSEDVYNWGAVRVGWYLRPVPTRGSD